MQYTPEKMDQELQAAKRHTRDHLCAWTHLVDGFSGPAHEDGKRVYQPENFSYEWVCNVLMQVIFTNPRVAVRSKRGGEHQLHAEGLKAAGDRWCIENQLDKFLRDGPALNMQFSRGIACVDVVPYASAFKYPKELEELDGSPVLDPVMPKCSDVDPNDFIVDPTRARPEDWMYAGHRTIWDKDELVKRAKADNARLEAQGVKEGKWDLDLLDKIASSVADPGSEEAKKRDGIQRDEIVLWELWCPKLEPSEEYDKKKYHGSIITLLDYAYLDKEAQRGFPRGVRPYYGCELGPYPLFDFLKKPGSGWPVAPLVATKGQADETNDESRALTAGANTYKRIGITTDKKLTETVKNAKHDTMHTLAAGTLKDGVTTIEVGGISAEQLAAFQFRRERLDRISGLTEASKGNASTGNTATADVIANAGMQVRMALLKAGVQHGTWGILYRVLWYIFHDNQIAIYLGNAPDGTELWFRGGPQDEQDSWESYEFEIEPYSMERTSEGLMQRQAAFLVTEFPQVAAIMPQSPHVPWGDWAAAMADLLNMPSIKKLVNTQALGQLQALFLQGAMQPEPTTGPSTPKQTPRMAAVPEAPKAPPTPGPTKAAAPKPVAVK